ncbi:MAG: DUF1643 domain-containing protein [Cyanobacteria bacterium P01_H01_bin.58]
MKSGQTYVVQRCAQFDDTGWYRYRLTRRWDDTQPELAFVMLNPSYANHREDDPTLRRCIRLAQQWQYGSLVVVNLFAYCTAYPAVLKTVDEPVGKENDRFILQACQTAKHILLAWGNGGSLHNRDHDVLQLLAPYRDRLRCLAVNRTGQPRHPLYVPRDTQLCSWPAAVTHASRKV